MLNNLYCEFMYSVDHFFVDSVQGGGYVYPPVEALKVRNPKFSTQIYKISWLQIVANKFATFFTF